MTLPFSPLPRSRADLRPGTLYAIDGGDSFIDYGQVAPEPLLGFFRFRSRVVSVAEALSSEIMSRFAVDRSSIGAALRVGKWLGLGRHRLRAELNEEPILVQWPVGTLRVDLWKGSAIVGRRRCAYVPRAFAVWSVGEIAVPSLEVSMPTSTTVKDEVRKLAEHLPDDATWEDVQYEIYLRQSIEVGLKDADEGRTVASDEARKRLGHS